MEKKKGETNTTMCCGDVDKFPPNKLVWRKVWGCFLIIATLLDVVPAIWECLDRMIRMFSSIINGLELEFNYEKEVT
ncbi:transmembrane protein, putative [Medicago truncatula]|uniref:Transmembrane protein, putative n=1 Tax=Medicago truncatula TaxID=3880 RepID=G7ZWD2_MEDTR|nr:transmembrane protein, putative [Medicago truncatula]